MKVMLRGAHMVVEEENNLNIVVFVFFSRQYPFLMMSNHIMSNLFTVKVLEVKNSDNGPLPREIEQFPNMLNAAIIKGRMVELQHSHLVGPSVKFKTVINYDRSLGPGETLGLTFVPREETSRQNPT